MIKLTQLKKLQVSKDFHFTSVTVQIVELYLDLSGFFFQSLIEPLVRKTGGKFIKPTEFDKLIHQFEGEVHNYFNHFQLLTVPLSLTLLTNQNQKIFEITLMKSRSFYMCDRHL